MTSVLTTDVHPRLATGLPDLLTRRGSIWTPSDLRDLTTTVANRWEERLLGTVRFASPRRWWARLALTDEVELWLLSWLPGQETRPHDHGGAAGSFTVLLGELSESFRYPGGPVRDHRHVRGSALGFGAGRAHQIRNLSSAPAASVHAYSPPLVPVREYASLRDIPAVIPAIPDQRTTA